MCVDVCARARAHTHTHTHNAPAGWSGASHEPKAGVLDLRSLVAATEVRVGWFLLYSFTYTLSLIFRNREHLTYKDTYKDTYVRGLVGSCCTLSVSIALVI